MHFPRKSKAALFDFRDEKCQGRIFSSLSEKRAYTVDGSADDLHTVTAHLDHQNW
jgi:hypothetical protein